MQTHEDEYRFNKAFGKRLAKRQKELGLSDYALAGSSEMPVRDLLVYKNGGRSMRTPRLVALAKALQVSADWLLGMDDTP